MDIWIAECRKTVKCNYCGEPIKLHTPMVVGRLWRTSKEGGEARRWVKNFRWHAQKETGNPEEPKICCWLQEGLEYLKQHPVEETRGRTSLELTKTQKAERLKILRQRARLMQKLKEKMLIPIEDQSEKDIEDMIKVGSQIEALKEQIAKFGGVPKSWE